MTPAAALESDVFLTFVAIVTAVLVLAGVILVVVRRVTGPRLETLTRTYVGWLIMTPAILAAIFLGRAAFIVFLALVSLLAMKEFARATGLHRDRGMTGAAYIGVLAVAVACIVTDPMSGAPGWYGLFISLPVYVIAGVLVIPITRNRCDGQLQSLALVIVGFVTIGWMFGHLSLLANTPQAYGLLMYLIFAVEVNDVAASLFGRWLGRHPLRSGISPNKTLEGAAGAMLVSLALPWAMRFALPGLTWIDLIVVGLVIGVGGQLGDLSMSVIKRDLGVKDMGRLIIGHGGVLDRIDSLIYTAPLFVHYLRLMHP